MKPTINALRFDTVGWKYHGEPEAGRLRVWETPDSDSVGLYIFDMPSNYPTFATLKEFCDFHGQGISAAGAEIIECTLQHLAQCRVLRLIIKAPQQPSGRFYQASYTFPFREFSYVIKVQCPEHGLTGVRETILFEKRMAAGETSSITGGPFFKNWNPDAPEHDGEFPTHPISRARRVLEHLARTATLDAAVASLPAFPLPRE